jgi:hypothetical protein
MRGEGGVNGGLLSLEGNLEIMGPPTPIFHDHTFRSLHLTTGTDTPLHRPNIRIVKLQLLANFFSLLTITTK